MQHCIVHEEPFIAFCNQLKEKDMDFEMRCKKYHQFRENKDGKLIKYTNWYASLDVWIVDKARYDNDYGREYMERMGYRISIGDYGQTKSEAKENAISLCQQSIWF